MDAERSRLFLLSIISVPAACGPGVPGGTVLSDGAIPNEDNDNALDPTNADDGPGPSGDGCEAFFGALVGCYIGRPEPGLSGGYDSYGNGGGYLDTPELAELCSYLDGIAADFGTDCVNAIDEALACMAPFACQDVGVQGLEELCAAEMGRFRDRCPGLGQDQPDTGYTASDTATSLSETGADTGFDGCTEPGLFTDSQTCLAQYDNCADGNVYQVECAPGPDGVLHTCVCTFNGGQTLTFETENPCTGAYESLAASSCGYPV
jgi:hypothetical protein